MMVKITCDGPSTLGTKVTTMGGAEIPGISKIVITAHVDDLWRAEIDLLVHEIAVNAEAKFLVKGRAVRRIEYEDGEVEEF